MGKLIKRPVSNIKRRRDVKRKRTRKLEAMNRKQRCENTRHIRCERPNESMGSHVVNNSSQPYSCTAFIDCAWTYELAIDEHYGYSSIMQSLTALEREKAKLGYSDQARVLNLLSRSASMMLVPHSVNEPFKPYFQDFERGRRSAMPEDFTEEELTFLEEILSDVAEPWLKSRLLDLLWLCKKPRNPEHARLAVDVYISHGIDAESWNRGVKECWERAARLCMQIRDFDRLDGIKNQLINAFHLEYPANKFMTLWLSKLMDCLKIDSEFLDDIATKLFECGKTLSRSSDFPAARSYFDLASQKYKQSGDERAWLDSLVALAASYEHEADMRLEESSMVANSLFENAVQAYRLVPTKFRDEYDISNTIKRIRTKISESGRASLDEMGVIRSPSVDISDDVATSKAHVSGKQTLERALLYFVGLYSGPNKRILESNAQEAMRTSGISSLFGSTHMSTDGRVVGITPPLNLQSGEDDPANQAVVNRQVQQHFDIEIQFVVEGKIIPALQQILMEYRVTKELMVSLCYQSPIVPEGREQLLGNALWFGFEYDFGVAIHLLCPQVEHIVRTKLKEVGAHTSNIDRNGIENENGLSTLMELPEAVEVFGEDLCFEVGSIFTDSLGANLRNEVAHGLLSDDSASSISSIYAWWLVLRLVLHSFYQLSSAGESS